MPRVQDAIPSLDCRAWKGRSNPLLLSTLRFAPESRVRFLREADTLIEALGDLTNLEQNTDLQDGHRDRVAFYPFLVVPDRLPGVCPRPAVISVDTASCARIGSVRIGACAAGLRDYRCGGRRKQGIPGGVMRGTTTASLSGGSFSVSDGSLTCGVDYNDLDTCATISIPVLCSDGRKSTITATETTVE
jgi:hypothetical protein